MASWKKSWQTWKPTRETLFFKPTMEVNMFDRTRFSQEMAVAAHQNIKEKEYWLDKLSGELVSHCFPYDYKKVNHPL